MDIILQNMIGSNLEIDRFHNLFTKVRQISFIESDSIFYFHKFLLMNFLDLTLNIYEMQMQMQPQRQQKEAIQLYLIYLLLNFSFHFFHISFLYHIMILEHVKGTERAQSSPATIIESIYPIIILIKVL